MRLHDRIKFDSEKQRYIVQAFDHRFVILTKPFNPTNSYLYTIVDLRKKVRGACGFLFGLNVSVDTPQSAAIALKELQTGIMQISHRNRVPLSKPEINQMQYLQDDTAPINLYA